MIINRHMILPATGTPHSLMDAEYFASLGMTITGMPALNAMRAVCEAPPGLLTSADLPLRAFAGRFPARRRRRRTPSRPSRADGRPLPVPAVAQRLVRRRRLRRPRRGGRAVDPLPGPRPGALPRRRRGGPGLRRPLPPPRRPPRRRAAACAATASPARSTAGASTARARLVEVPGLDRPPRAGARAWEVCERNGRIFVWHHAEDAPAELRRDRLPAGRGRSGRRGGATPTGCGSTCRT